MARRIELPGADVLFGEGKTPAKNPARRDAPSRGGKSTPRRASKKSAAAAGTSAAKSSPAPSPAPRKKTAARSKTAATRKSPRTQVERLESIESRLAELPVEALIDLRDGLEEMLTADRVDEQAVRRLLDTVEL